MFESKFLKNCFAKVIGYRFPANKPSEYKTKGFLKKKSPANYNRKYAFEKIWMNIEWSIRHGRHLIPNLTMSIYNTHTWCKLEKKTLEKNSELSTAISPSSGREARANHQFEHDEKNAMIQFNSFSVLASEKSTIFCFHIHICVCVHRKLCWWCSGFDSFRFKQHQCKCAQFRSVWPGTYLVCDSMETASVCAIPRKQQKKVLPALSGMLAFFLSTSSLAFGVVTTSVVFRRATQSNYEICSLKP